MEVRPQQTGVGPVRVAPFRRQLAELRVQVKKALNDDWENPAYPLDELDLSWLSSLPSTLPRGSILNILV